MASLAVLPSPESSLLLRGITWGQHLTLRETLKHLLVHLDYLQGTLELLIPSAEHEMIKKTPAMLLGCVFSQPRQGFMRRVRPRFRIKQG